MKIQLCNPTSLVHQETSRACLHSVEFTGHQESPHIPADSSERAAGSVENLLVPNQGAIQLPRLAMLAQRKPLHHEFSARYHNTSPDLRTTVAAQRVPAAAQPQAPPLQLWTLPATVKMSHQTVLQALRVSAIRVKILRRQKPCATSSFHCTREKSNYSKKVNEAFEPEEAGGNLASYLRVLFLPFPHQW